MNKKILSIGLIFLVLFFVQLCSAQDSDPDQTGTNVKLLELDGAIGPIAVQIIEKGIDQAEKANSEALIILLNTPGGLTESTWKITKAIMNSYVPVVVYIYPQGARAGSAGVFITFSAHIAAMAPATNIGAASVVSMGGEMDSTMYKKGHQ